MDTIFKYISNIFEINTLADFQNLCLETLHDNKSVFVLYKTGHRKSLCYEAFLLYCYLNGFR